MAIAALALCGPACGVVTTARLPSVKPPTAEAREHDGAIARVGPAYLARRGRLWVMQAGGDPAEIGYRHAELTRELMADGDRRMDVLLREHVPFAPFRWALTALARFEYRGLEDAFPDERRAEIYGEARAVAGADGALAPAYDRLVYLHGLYDIALAFERSPLLGCTGFAASGSATVDGTTPGHTIVGRNFDLDIDPWFDVEKVVQVVQPNGGIAFASVAWPGMTGVVTGMNLAGIWISVNGGRASEPRSGGVPVVFTTRAVLEHARSLDEALDIIARDEPMASHILLLADGKTGESMVVERAPDRPLGVLRDATSITVSNHFRTPSLRGDPKDARVRDITSTVARGERIDELVRARRGAIDPRVTATMLRDRAAVGGGPLPLGNRSALDAMIATHSVIADLSARVLWVSEGPHTLGAYRAIDLAARVRDGAKAAEHEAGLDLPADAMLADGTYERFSEGLRLRREATKREGAGALDEAADLLRKAIALRADDHVAWRALAELEDRRAHHDEARIAWTHVAALAPESPEARREAEAHVRDR